MEAGVTVQGLQSELMRRFRSWVQAASDPLCDLAIVPWASVSSLRKVGRIISSPPAPSCLGALLLSCLMFWSDRASACFCSSIPRGCTREISISWALQDFHRLSFGFFHPCYVDQTQSDVTLNDVIFKEDIRRACIKDITYLPLELGVSARCPILAMIKWQ